MLPDIFYLIEEHIHHHIRKSVINFRNYLEGLKLAITLRHLATGETYTSLQYHWLAGRTTINLYPRSGGGECIWNISEQIQGTTGHHGERLKVVRDIVFTCVLLTNMLRTHQGASDRAPIPANYVAALQKEQVVYVPDDNHRNPLWEDKHQRDLLKVYFNRLGVLAGQNDRI